MRIFRRPQLTLIACVIVALTPLGALAELSFDGTIVAGETLCVTAPFGGTVEQVNVRAGDTVATGDTIATIATTKVYASASGTVSGVFAQSGDSVEDISARYGGVLYIAPESKYSISADIEKAYNSSATRYVVIGEMVYISCTSDASRTAEGIITAVEGTGYTVETTSGELLMGETVNIYRSSGKSSSSRIGRGTVSRTKEISVGGSGSVLAMYVQDGDSVARGDLLFETVEGTLDGLYATDNRILSTSDGVVASVNVTAGGKIGKGEVAISVYPSDALQVKIEVGEYDLGEIHEGDAAVISFNYQEDDAAGVAGVVSHISHISDAAEGDASYTAYITFTPDANTRIGMTVSVTVGEDAQEALAISGEEVFPEETAEPA